MFLSYTAGVVLVSLAIYGLWQIIKDIWGWINNFNTPALPSASLVIILKNMENDVEYLMRFLSWEMVFLDAHPDEKPIDIIIADAGSTDLTLSILTRLAEENNFFTLISLSNTVKPLSEILPFCRGSLIHVCDLTGRLKKEEFEPAARFLLKDRN